MSSSLANQVAALNLDIANLQLSIGTASVATILSAVTNLGATVASLSLQVAIPGNDPGGVLAAELAADSQTLLNISAAVVCYMHGTHILTERGEVAVENLQVGDKVVTPHGPEAVAAIRWIGRQHFEGDASRFTQPVLVRAGALGDGLPHRDLRVSPDHCLHLDGRLVPAKLLLNGNSIVMDRGHEVVDYLNIELDQHSIVLAEGIESETYLDCGNRSRFDNADELSDWVASRAEGSDAAWHDGRAVAQPLWDGPELAALVARIAARNEMAEAA